MAISVPVLLGKATGNTGTTTSPTITTTVDSPAGALIFLIATFTDGGPTLSSVADSAGNTYVAGVNSPTTPNGSLEMRAFYVANAKALPSGSIITPTFATADAVRKIIAAVSVTGILAVSPSDAEGAGTAATTATPSITTGTLAQANEIIFGYLGISGYSAAGFTEASGFTQLAGPPDATMAPGDAANLAYKIVASTSAVAYAPTIGGSRHNVINSWAFKGAPDNPSSGLSLMGVG